MSKYNIGEKDDWNFRLVKREGRVEMWEKLETNSFKVCLYEHVKQDEECLFHTTKFDQKSAHKTFSTTVKLLK